MIAAVRARVQGWLAFAAAALATIGAAHLAGRRDGRNARRVEAMREEEKAGRARDTTPSESQRAGAHTFSKTPSEGLNGV